jgi:hypothetical protein
LGCTTRDGLAERKGEPSPADNDRDTVCRSGAAPPDERRPRSPMVVGCASCRATAGSRLPSRANSGLTSAVERTSTPRKTRSISPRGLASDGDRVANGPVITTPVRSPAVGITRSPGLASRARFGLAKSPSGTTIQPRRSTSANRTRPERSTAGEDANRDVEASPPTLPVAVRGGGITSRRGGWPAPPPAPGYGGL